MIILISPAKSLNVDPIRLKASTQPRFLEKSEILASILKKKSPGKLKSLMSISDNLASLNYDRYQTFSLPFTHENAKPAIFTFRGDVYVGLDADTLSGWDIKWAQKHLRILSGLYGILRPLDIIQPYRLEMGTQLKNKKGKNLYAFWGSSITDEINADAAEIGTDIIVNLASKEYFKAVQNKKINGKLYHINFLEKRNGEFKFISFTAKKARGWMSRFIIQNRITKPQHLKGFMHEGFLFNPDLSSGQELIFTR